jgi:hypothetical protein
MDTKLVHSTLCYCVITKLEFRSQKHCNICLFFQVNSWAVMFAHMLLRTMLTMQQCINAKSD